MFRAWQLGVTLAATVYMLLALAEGTPFFVAIPAALLAMSVLASDSEGKK